MGMFDYRGAGCDWHRREAPGRQLANAVPILVRVAVHMDVGGKDADVAGDAAIDGAAQFIAIVAEAARRGDPADVAAVLQHVDRVAGTKADRAADRAEARGRFARAGLHVDGFEYFGLDRHAADMAEQRTALRRADDRDVEQRILETGAIRVSARVWDRRLVITRGAPMSALMPPYPKADRPTPPFNP